MLHFTLIVNQQERDGFRLSVKAESQEEVKIAKELTEKLIEKIKEINVKVTNYED